MLFATSGLFQRSDPVEGKTKISAVMPQRVRSSGFATEMRPDAVRPAHNDCELLLESSIGAFLDLAAPAWHALICPSPQILTAETGFHLPCKHEHAVLELKDDVLLVRSAEHRRGRWFDHP